MLLIWAAGLVPHVPLLADVLQHAHLRRHALLRPAEERAERLRQELAAVTFKEYALQDGNTLEATQTMLESRAVTEFPLNDQEILLRHLHKTARDYVADYQKKSAHAGPDLGRLLRQESTTRHANAARRLRRPRAVRRLVAETESERYAKRLSSTMDELQAFYDAAFPRLEDAMAYLDRFDLNALPEDASSCCGCATRWSTPRSRSRCGASHACPTAEPPAWTW